MKIFSTCLGLALVAVAGAVIPRETPRDTPLTNGRHSVAFVLTEGATMIDFAGPWEVFQDVVLDGNAMHSSSSRWAPAERPFEPLAA
jgi:hypothetical protein